MVVETIRTHGWWELSVHNTTNHRYLVQLSQYIFWLMLPHNFIGRFLLCFFIHLELLVCLQFFTLQHLHQLHRHLLVSVICALRVFLLFWLGHQSLSHHRFGQLRCQPLGHSLAASVAMSLSRCMPLHIHLVTGGVWSEGYFMQTWFHTGRTSLPSPLENIKGL